MQKILKILKSLIFLCLFFSLANKVYAAGPGEVMITEIKTGETGATNNEFIELFNKTDQNIDLTGWSLKKKTQSGTESNLISAAKFAGIIKANGFLLIAHPTYKDAIGADAVYSGSSYSLASDNTVVLYDAEDAIIDKLGYGEAADFSGAAAPALETNQSLSRKFIDGVFVNTNNNLTDFEILISPDPQNSASLISNISQTGETAETVQTEGIAPAAPIAHNIALLEDVETSAKNKPEHDGGNDIIISEIFPNPYLGDAGEWIEFYNKGEDNVILTGWRIGDDSGQQYRIATGTMIKMKSFLVICRKDSRIILDNNKDSVKLYKPLHVTAVETVRYKTAPEGQSYARDLSVNNRWLWTKEPTLGEGNIVEPANSEPEASFYFPLEAPAEQPIVFDGSDSLDDDGDTLIFKWSFGDGATSSLETAEHTFWKAGTYAINLFVSDGKVETKKEKKIKITGDKFGNTASSSKEKKIKAATADKTAKTASKTKTTKSANTKSIKNINLQIAGENLIVGSFKKLTGIVAVKPGIFGAQYFYMVGSPGIQVYNYKKDFPELTVGDRIEAVGIISDNNGEARLKIKSQADIKIIENRGAPESVNLAGGEVDGDAVNGLAQIQGEVTDKKGQSVFIDDGSGEAEAYIKKGTGIAMAAFKKGESVTMTGLVIKYKDGYRLMPRSIDDVKTENKGEVLGAAITNDEWSLAERDKKKELTAYLAVIVGGAVLAGGGFLLKKKMVGVFSSQHVSPKWRSH